MPKLPRISGKEMKKFLGKMGFSVIRSRGSHFFLENKTVNKRTTVPVHGNETLRPGIILGILSDIDMSKDEFCRLKKTM